MTLDDVRAEIDRLDDQIIALLARRQEQVRAVVAFKHDEQEVRAPVRRAAVMDRVRARASAEGLDPSVAEAVWAAMIDAFIALELRDLRADG